MNLPTWDKAENVLCVRLDSLGDVLMTTPALRALKVSHSKRKITLLTSPSGAAVGRLIPEVDEVIVYEAPWMKATPERQNPLADFEMIDTLRKGGFDAAVIFTVFSQNPLPAAFMAFLSGIPLRLAHSRENPYQLLTDWVPEASFDNEEDMPHEVRRQLDMVASIGVTTEDESLSLSVPLRTQRAVLRKLTNAGIDPDKPLAVIHPGATAPSRRYPPEHYSEVARRLVVDYGWQIVFTGSDNECDLVEKIRVEMRAPAVSLAGELNLAELAALIDIVPILITNNTGPVHIAAALGTPVVDIYALTNPQHSPWGVPSRVLYHDVPCKYCYKSICPLQHHDCLQRLMPEQVVAAVLELAEETFLQNH